MCNTFNFLNFQPGYKRYNGQFHIRIQSNIDNPLIRLYIFINHNNTDNTTSHSQLQNRMTFIRHETTPHSTYRHYVTHLQPKHHTTILDITEQLLRENFEQIPTQYLSENNGSTLARFRAHFQLWETTCSPIDLTVRSIYDRGGIDLELDGERTCSTSIGCFEN